MCAREVLCYTIQYSTYRMSNTVASVDLAYGPRCVLLVRTFLCSVLEIQIHHSILEELRYRV
jgi:hypothetical protein